MPDLISRFKAAGFSDEEIGNWSTGFRQRMNTAGFNDDEISRYLDGNVQPPATPPPNFLARLNSATHLPVLDNLAKGFGEGAKAGFGSEPLGSDELSWMRSVGMISDPDQGMPGPIRLLTDAINKPVAIAADALRRLLGAALGGIVGAARKIGPKTGEAIETGLQVATDPGLAATLTGLGPPGALAGGLLDLARPTIASILARSEVDAAGHAIDVPIGTLPEAEDFGSTAKAIAGEDAAPSVQRKLLELYSQNGVHPSEVAHDAASDPGVAQSIVSRGTDLPDRYTGPNQVAERVPPEPQRLNSWIVRNGGVKDPGGDIRTTIGGPRGRPGLINNRSGMNLDDAALKAWEDGYFPTDERPSVNDFLDAVAEDHNLRPRYSGVDAQGVAAFQGAMARNAEVDRLAQEHGIDPAGMSRDQFWDTIADRMSEDERDREIASMGQAHEQAFAEAEARTRAWFEARGDAWEPDEFYRGVPATEEDLERADQFEGEARWQHYLAQIGGEGEGGVEEPGIAGRDQEHVEAGAGSGGVGTEPATGAGAPRPVAAGAGEPATELTEQGEQMVMPGMERSAVQAMRAREAEGGGMIRAAVPQLEPGGIFQRPETPQNELEFGPETGAISWGKKPPPAPGSFEEAQDSILSKLSIGEPGPRRPMTLSRMYTNIFEKLYPISEVTPPGTPTFRNPYRLTRLLAGLAGKIDHFLVRGTYDFNTYKINGASLQDVLDPVKDDLDGFRAFGAAARGLELEARDITTGLDSAAMRRVVREGLNKYEPVLTGLVEYQNRVAAYLRDSGVLSRDGYDVMTEANRLYVPFQRVMGDGDGFHGAGQTLQASNPIKRIAGSEREIVDPIESIIRNTASMITMAERNAAGTKLIDMLTAAGDIGFGERQPIKALELPPDPALDAALRDFLSRNGIDRSEGLLDFLHSAASQPENRGTISIFRDGTRHTYQVDPELARAWKGLDAQTAGAFEQLMRPFARTLRAGAVLTPDFAMRHTIRDYLYAAVTSPGLFSPADMARGFMGLISKDEPYWRWVQGGGANISMVTVDRRYLQEDIARLTQQTGLVTRMMNTVADPNAGWLTKGGAVVGLPFKVVGKYVLHPLQVLTELAENASHLGAYIKAERGMEEAGLEIGKPEIQEAAFASRDVAVDAARIGAKTRAYNMITAFANITLQDTDRVARAFYNNPARTSIAVGGGIVLPSALLWWAQHDDPRYHEIPQWQRDLAWIVLTNKWDDAGPANQFGPPAPGSAYRVVGDRLQINNGAIFRIPKPWGMGVVFGSGTERALEAFAAHNPEAFQHWSQSIFGVVVPQFVPTAGAPILNQWTNRDTFTNRTLVPDRMEKWLPEYQYTPYTTETTKALGKIIGAFPGVRGASISPDSPVAGGVARALTSPILLENYIRGWSGNLGMYALATADAALRKSGVLPDPPKPTAALADIPVVRAFIVRYPSATTQSIQDFEDTYARNDVFYQTWQAKAKEGDADAAARISAMGGPQMFVRLDGIKKALTEHNKLIQDIYRDPTSSPSDKRQLIDTLYFRMIELGQAGKAAMTQINQSLGEPPKP